MERLSLNAQVEYRPLLVPIVKRVALLLAFGIALSVAVGTLTYKVLASSQEATFKREYDTMADQIILSAQVLLSRSTDVAQTVAEMYATQYPNYSSWPLVSVSRYSQVVSPLVAMLGALNVNHVPIVQPSRLADFESYAYKFFSSDPEGFEGIGESHFGRGVYAFNSSGVRYHDTSGNTTYSEFNFIAPIFQIVNADINSAVVMYNTHSERVRGQGIDAVVDCFYSPNTTSLQECTTITDFIFLIQQNNRENPAAIMYYPESPANSRSNLTGFVGVVLPWDSMLSKILPFGKSSKYLYLVLRSSHRNGTAMKTVTYQVSNGKVSLMGSGDLSDHKLKNFDRDGEVNSDVGTASTSVKYHLHIIPNRKLLLLYVNKQPLMISIWISLAIFGVLALVILYDTLVHARTLNDDISQGLRRVYVRWVSHEMRSPLNAVFLAVTTLETAMSSNDSPRSFSPSPDDTLVARGSSNFIKSLIQEIKLGVENSVTVLDDLLEYSCLDTWRAESRPMDVWALARKVTLSFSQSAADRGVVLHVRQNSATPTQSQEEEGLSASTPMMVLGDAEALSRALASVLRSSLKVSSSGDIIRVQVSMETPDSPAEVKATTCFSEAAVKQPFVIICIEHTCLAVNETFVDTSDRDKSRFDVGKLRTDRNNGLALWMASSIVRSHGGALEVRVDNDRFLTNIRLPLGLDVADYDSSLERNMSGESIPEEVNSSEVSNATRDSTAANADSCRVKRSGSGISLATLRRVKMNPMDSSDSGSEQSQVERGDAEPPPAAAPPRFSSKVVPCPEESQLQLKILVVDDVLSNRRILSHLLTSRGHACTMAADGLECIKLVTECSLTGNRQFDAICMDYEMPNCNGPDATQRLRKLGFNMPVIGVTGNVLPVDVEYFRAQGAVEVLGKPVHLDTLQKVLLRCCRDR